MILPEIKRNLPIYNSNLTLKSCMYFPLDSSGICSSSLSSSTSISKSSSNCSGWFSTISFLSSTDSYEVLYTWILLLKFVRFWFDLYYYQWKHKLGFTLIFSVAGRFLEINWASLGWVVFGVSPIVSTSFDSWFCSVLRFAPLVTKCCTNLSIIRLIALSFFFSENSSGLGSVIKLPLTNWLSTQ